MCSQSWKNYTDSTLQISQLGQTNVDRRSRQRHTAEVDRGGHKQTEMNTEPDRCILRRIRANGHGIQRVERCRLRRIEADSP
jgi:hypothetical protein